MLWSQHRSIQRAEPTCEECNNVAVQAPLYDLLLHQREGAGDL